MLPFTLKRVGTFASAIRHRKLFRRLGPGDLAIDCGASVGDITARMAQQGATVMAFEPHPVAYDKLSKRFASQDNVRCFQMAIWDQDATRPMYLHHQRTRKSLFGSTSSSLLSQHPAVQEEVRIEVATLALGRMIVAQGKRVKLVKMDIEGAEYRVVKSLIGTGAIKLIDTLLVESHARHSDGFDVMEQDLRQELQLAGHENVLLNWG